MSNRVAILTSALADRRSELEEAERKLAEHSTLLEQATAELTASNGDFEIWQRIDQRVRFERRQVERYQSIIQQCNQNVDCASKALAAAQRETAIEALQQSRAKRQSKAQSIAADIAGHYQAVLEGLASLQPLQAAEQSDVSELARLGVRTSVNHVVHSLWLACMSAFPGTAPVCFGLAAELGRDLRKNLDSVFKLEPASARQIAKLRQSFGDTTAVIPEEPKPQPAKAAQVEDYREGVSERSYQGFRYRYETWVCARDSRTEYRLLLPDESSLPFGVSILSEDHAELEHGLTARLCKTSDGSQVLLAPSKALTEVAASSIRAAAEGVRNLLGLNEDQPSR
jgi:hypothetical protein